MPYRAASLGKSAAMVSIEVWIALLRTTLSDGESWSSRKNFITIPTVGALTNRVKRTNPHTSVTMNCLISMGNSEFSYTARASASETAPRNPPHHITVRNPFETGMPSRRNAISGIRPWVSKPLARNAATRAAASTSQ